MEHTSSRRGPAFARRGKGTGGTQHGDRTQGVQRIDRAARDSRSEPRFGESPSFAKASDGRPGNKPAYMKDGRRGARTVPFGPRPHRVSDSRDVNRPKFDQRKAGPRAAGAASSTSWENVAEWYGTHLSAPGTYQSEVVWPGAMKLLGVGPGKTFLDVACGEGSFAQLVTRNGGSVVGIDAAPTLIRQAQNKHIRNAEFLVGDAVSADRNLKDRKFDGAAVVLALQNINDMPGMFASVAKVLNKNAPIVIVLNHPAFRIPRQSSWGFEDERKLMYRRVDSYMSEAAIPMQMHPGDAPTINTTSFHRPISSYITALSASGFVVDAMEEWISHKESTSGPRAKAENRVRREVPMFLAIRGRKV